MPDGCHVKPEQFFNLIFGYHDRYSATKTEFNPGGAPISLILPAVDPGEVWVLNTFWGMNGTRDDNIQLKVNAGGEIHYLAYGPSGGAARPIIWNGAIPLKQGDTLFVTFWANQAGDDLYCGALGSKMKLTQ
jgi:hypothetical protein